MDKLTIEARYKKGTMPKEMVKIAVRKGVITKDDYKRITGENYPT